MPDPERDPAPDRQLEPEFALDRVVIAQAVRELARHLLAESALLPAGEPPPLPERLPEQGVGQSGALSALAPMGVRHVARLGDPGYLAHMDPPAAAVTWATAIWVAALNQNTLHPETGPSARRLEQTVVSWLAPPFGMDGGHLVPGSSLANLTALWVARESRGVRYVVASDQCHLSVRRAAAILGLEFVQAPSDEGHRLCLHELDSDLLSEAALVLTAGTVSSGAVDPLSGGPEAKWRHIDAAWAGPLRFSKRHSSLLDGVETADSVCFSAHKLLFQPKGCAAVLFRQTAAAHAAITTGAAYLAAPSIGLMGSAPASALPLCATLLAWGRAGLQQRLDRAMTVGERLAERVSAEPSLELRGEPATGIVLWRPRRADPAAVRSRLRQAFVSLTEVDEEPWFRSVPANPDADPDWVVDAVLRAMP